MPKDRTNLFNLTLPFPPKLTVDDLLERSRGNGKSGRIPNCFLCYRLSWTEHLKRIEKKAELSEISGFVGHRWKNERKEVKDYYRKLSADAKKKYSETNKSCTFIYHNKCGLNNVNEKIQDEVVSLGSVDDIGDSIGTASISFESPFTQTQQQINQPQFTNSFDFSNEWCSPPLDTTITTDLNQQNCSLKDFMIDALNSFTDSEYYARFHLTTIIAPEEIESFKKLQGYFRSLINEKKTTMLNRFYILNEKIQELESVVKSNINSDINGNAQEACYFDPSRGIFPDFIPYGENIEGHMTQSDPLQGLLAPLNAINPTNGYPNPNLTTDSLFFPEQFNNNHLLERNKVSLDEGNKMLLEERSERKTKELEDRLIRIQEIVKAIREMVFGNNKI